jgi:hypothetical protein
MCGLDNNDEATVFLLECLLVAIYGMWEKQELCNHGTELYSYIAI